MPSVDLRRRVLPGGDRGGVLRARARGWIWPRTRRSRLLDALAALVDLHLVEPDDRVPDKADSGCWSPSGSSGVSRSSMAPSCAPAIPSRAVLRGAGRARRCRGAGPGRADVGATSRTRAGRGSSDAAPLRRRRRHRGRPAHGDRRRPVLAATRACRRGPSVAGRAPQPGPPGADPHAASGPAR